MNATSYIPTEGTTVTRAADNCSITGSDFTDFYNQNEGTFLIEASTFYAPPNTVNSYLYQLNDGYSVLRLNTFRTSGRLIINSVDQSLSFSAADIFDKFAVSHNSNSTKFSINGSISSALAGVTVSGKTIISIGRTTGGISHLNGTIKKLIYYPKALPDTDLQLLTRI
jgi:hypothetical protein